MKAIKAGIILFLALLFVAPIYGQKIKLGYINSQKILSEYKEALDVQKKIDELNQQWEKELLEMQNELRKLREQFDAQSLLLSESKKKEKEKEIQELDQKLQRFRQDKWAPEKGEIYKKEAEFMKPIYEKIFNVIRKIGEEEEFDYIFDTVEGNILYASDRQEDLTKRVLDELNKGLTVKK